MIKEAESFSEDIHVYAWSILADKFPCDIEHVSSGELICEYYVMCLQIDN